MKLVILRSAQNDLTDGFWFYEKQAAGLGRYFLDSLLTEIESLLTHAGFHRKAFAAHRLLSRRFPYAIYYEMTEDTVQIKAVLDCRRNPAVIKKRLRQAHQPFDER